MRTVLRSICAVTAGGFVFVLLQLLAAGLAYWNIEIFRESFFPLPIGLLFLPAVVAGYVAATLSGTRPLLHSLLLSLSSPFFTAITTAIYTGRLPHLYLPFLGISFFGTAAFIYQTLLFLLGGSIRLWKLERSPLPLVLFAWIAALGSLAICSYAVLLMGMSVTGRAGVDWNARLQLGLVPLVTLGTLVVIHRFQIHKKYPRSFYFISALCFLELLVIFLVLG